MAEKVMYPDCQQGCSRYDHAPERQWRHLDTMQFETRIKAALPRVNCPTCSIKTTTAPWAEKHSRFTLMYKAFAIAVLQACGNIKQAADLLRLK